MRVHWQWPTRIIYKHPAPTRLRRLRQAVERVVYPAWSAPFVIAIFVLAAWGLLDVVRAVVS